jgi:hypothetical protein
VICLYVKTAKNTPCRYTDIVVDSPDPAYSISIRCKSIIDRNLYLTQHFHAGKNTMHPLQVHSDFLLKNRPNRISRSRIPAGARKNT